MTEAPNMTATEIAKAKHPSAPGQIILSDLINREISALPIGTCSPDEKAELLGLRTA